jgi:hypothetical protein
MYYINNTLNDVLVSCERAIPILIKDIKLKPSNQTTDIHFYFISKDNLINIEHTL